MWSPADLFTHSVNAVLLSLERAASYLYEHPVVLTVLLVAIAAVIGLAGLRKT